MKYFITPQREDRLFLEDIKFETIAPLGSPARVIDEMVEMLNTSELEKRYRLDYPSGVNAIHPKTFIKIALFAIHSCRFSLRKMEEDLKYNLQYRWLSGDARLDHSTLGKFLAKFKKEIVRLFAQTVTICVQHNLVNFEVLAIDTVKIRANANYKNSRTEESLEKSVKKTEQEIKKLIENVDKEEKEEKQLEILKKKKESLENAKTVLRERIVRKSKDKTEKEIEEIKKKERINLTDHDAHIIQQANGENNTAYASTVSVDEKADIITSFRVNEENNDPEALIPVIERSEKNSGRKHKAVLSDSGFSSINNLEKLEEKNQFALIPDRRYEIEKNGAGKKGEYGRNFFKYEKEKDLYICPKNKKLEYKKTIKVKGRKQKQYENKKACEECSFRKECTKGSKRIIQRDYKEELKEKMREMLDREENGMLYKKRSHCAESPFGDIKMNKNYKMIRRRGKEKAEMEFALLFIEHNLLKFEKYAKKRENN